MHVTEKYGGGQILVNVFQFPKSRIQQLSQILKRKDGKFQRPRLHQPITCPTLSEILFSILYHTDLIPYSPTYSSHPVDLSPLTSVFLIEGQIRGEYSIR